MSEHFENTQQALDQEVISFVDKFISDNNRETPAYSPTAEVIKAQDEVLYDAQAQQKYIFTSDDDIEITHVYAPVSDDRFFAYERNARLKIVDDGTSVVSENSEALGELFDDVILDVQGYEGEKPENWKSMLDTEQEKIPSILLLIAVSAFSETKKTWGQSESTLTEARFNGEIIGQKHFLRKKTTEDVRDYRRFQKILIASKAKGLKSAETVIPSTAKGKAQLYDRMVEKAAEGYAGGIVPAWHKIAVVDHLFAAGLTAKK